MHECNHVKCNVSNCEFHDKTGICRAHEIEVGPHYANSSNDTICSTFKAEQD